MYVKQSIQIMPSAFSFLCEVVRVLSEAGLRMDTSDGYTSQNEHS